jgi:hypothetical protein
VVSLESGTNLVGNTVGRILEGLLVVGFLEGGFLEGLLVVGFLDAMANSCCYPGTKPWQNAFVMCAFT